MPALYFSFVDEVALWDTSIDKGTCLYYSFHVPIYCCVSGGGWLLPPRRQRFLSKVLLLTKQRGLLHQCCTNKKKPQLSHYFPSFLLVFLGCFSNIQWWLRLVLLSCSSGFFHQHLLFCILVKGRCRPFRGPASFRFLYGAARQEWFFHCLRHPTQHYYCPLPRHLHSVCLKEELLVLFLFLGFFLLRSVLEEEDKNARLLQQVATTGSRQESWKDGTTLRSHQLLFRPERRSYPVGIPCVLVSHVGRRSLIQKAPATGILAWVLLSWLRRGERFCSIGVLVLPRGLHTILRLNLLPHFILVSVLSPLRCPSS